MMPRVASPFSAAVLLAACSWAAVPWVAVTPQACAQSTPESTIYRPQAIRVSGPPPQGGRDAGVVTATGNLPLPPSSLAHSQTTALSPVPEARIPLKSSLETKAARVAAPRSPWAGTLSTVFSLGVVVSLFLLGALALRRAQPKQFQKLPRQVVEVLGRSPLGPRQQLVVLRFGSKLVLVSQQPGETQSIAEITDAAEADRLAGLCETQRPESVSNSFRDVLHQVALGTSKKAAG